VTGLRKKNYEACRVGKKDIVVGIRARGVPKERAPLTNLGGKGDRGATQGGTGGGVAWCQKGFVKNTVNVNIGKGETQLNGATSIKRTKKIQSDRVKKDDESTLSRSVVGGWWVGILYEKNRHQKIKKETTSCTFIFGQKKRSSGDQRYYKTRKKKGG